MRIVAVEEKNGTGQKGVRNVKLFSKNILLRAEQMCIRDSSTAMSSRTHPETHGAILHLSLIHIFQVLGVV